MKPTKYSALLIVACFTSFQAWSQTTDVDLPSYWLDEVVVVADRVQNRLHESAWATSVLTAEALRQIPAKTLGDALRHIPGITFVEKDGSGHLSMAIVRGFFGGGETEYILLTVDGVPTNDLRTGLAEWSQIPVSEIERIEVLRGGASAVYGDAALGAVINIKTRDSESGKHGGANLAFGQRSERSLNVTNAFRLGKHRVRMGVSNNRSDGFRSHSNWENNVLKGRYDLGAESAKSIYVQWNLARLENQDPGPLMTDQIAGDRTRSNALFALDKRRRDRLDATVGFQTRFSSTSKLKVDLGMKLLNQDQTRTLLVAPSFGDTQFQSERNSTFWSRWQYQQQTSNFSWLAGLDAEFGTYDSKYFDVQNREILNSLGSGDRLRAGLYVEAQHRITRRLRTTASVRYDYIRDQHESHLGATPAKDFNQLSPRLGLNFSYFDSPDHSGSVYANWTRSFKAPSLDQRFDERQINSGAPGVFFNISNNELKPQRSHGFEVGLYQKVPVGPRIYSEFTVSAYRLELDDEIDFDLATFQYGNIQKSRHDGIEGSVTLYFLPRLSLTSTVNYMDVTFRSGDNEGNALKNIPRETVQNALTVYLTSNLELDLAHRYQSKVFLDDANTMTLSGHQAFDGKLRIMTNKFGLSFLIKNLANKRYNSSGFALFDQQTFENVAFLYPAEGRYFQSSLDFPF
jgi:outer membrane cobalamin receptor